MQYLKSPTIKLSKVELFCFSMFQIIDSQKHLHGGWIFPSISDKIPQFSRLRLQEISGSRAWIFLTYASFFVFFSVQKAAFVILGHEMEPNVKMTPKSPQILFFPNFFHLKFERNFRCGSGPEVHRFVQTTEEVWVRLLTRYNLYRVNLYRISGSPKKGFWIC